MEDDDSALYAIMRPAKGGKSLVTLCTYKERQEALNRTSIMEDDSSHRTSRNFPNEKSSSSDTAEMAQQVQQQNIPPPPPQFANSPPKNQGIYGMHIHTLKKVNNTSVGNKSTTSNNNIKQQSNINAPKPPNSPTPDYDSLIEIRKGRQIQANEVNPSYNKNIPSATLNGNEIGNGNVNVNGNRRTMRFSGVTIGEYEQQRKEPGKFEFVGNKNRDTANGSRNVDNLHSELHDTLSRSKLKNGSQVEHKRDCPLRNGYANGQGNGNGNSVDQLTRKIQSASLNQKQAQFSESTSTMKRQNGSTTANGIGTSTGILKNGNSRNSGHPSNGLNGHSAKLVEKTITFGN